MRARGLTVLVAAIGVAYGAAMACGDATGDVFVRATAPFACMTDDACDEDTPVCDVASGECRACASDRDCGGVTPRCAASGACVECRDATDCDDVEDDDLALCDDRGRCVECLNDGHCDDVEETCSPFLGKCAEPCSATVACGSDEPICDLAIGYCVECRTDDDCDDDELCRSSECVD